MQKIVNQVEQTGIFMGHRFVLLQIVAEMDPLS
jgi:hypothetical protein